MIVMDAGNGSGKQILRKRPYNPSADIPTPVNERFPLPELAFLLDVPATECMKRIAARGAVSELYEKRRFLEEARSCYEYIWPAQYPVINGTMSVREIEKMIRDTVSRRMGI